jgi:magnesium-transporting ATPase (P-type)
VKRPSAVETLGATTVICTDKTRTLTENRMQVDRVATAERELRGESREWAQQAASDRALRALAAAAAACNNADLAGGEEAAGDRTEIALLRAAAALGADPDAQRRRATP